MKHVSRVLFGFSIVAVLALFTACPQAADTKKDAPNPNPLGLDQKKAAALIGRIDSIKDNFEIDNTSGAITLKKGAAETIMLPKTLDSVSGLTLKDAKVTKGTSVTAAKASGDAGFTLTVTKPTANKAEMVTIQLTVAGKDKSGKIVDSVFTIVVTNKKDIDEGGSSGTGTPAAIGNVSAVATTGTAGGVTLKMENVTGDDDTYDKVKITVVKFNSGSTGETTAAKFANPAGSGAAVEAIEIAKTDFATKHLTDATGYNAVVESPTPDAHYEFTFQLLNNTENAGEAKKATSKLGS